MGSLEVDNMHRSVCFLAPKAPPIGGIATWYSIVENECKTNGINTFLINSSVDLKEIDANKFKKMFLKYKRLKRNVSDAKRLFREEKIDALHIATSGGFGFYRDCKIARLAKRRNISVCVHFHFGRLPKIIEDKGREYKALIKLLTYVDHAICIDPKSFDSLKGIFSPCSFICNPVPIYNDTDPDKSRDIVFVGSLNKNKGIYELLSSFKKIEGDYQTSKLKIIGPIDHFEQSEISQLISNHANDEQIRFLGELNHEDTIKEMKTSRFLVLPSKTEGMPYAILESMAMGLPVIATNVGSVAYLIGDCGLLLDEKCDVDVLAQSMKKMLDDDKMVTELNKQSKTKAALSFSPDVVIKELVDVWFEGGNNNGKN